MPPRGTLAAGCRNVVYNADQRGPIIVLQCHFKITRVQSRTIAKLWGQNWQIFAPYILGGENLPILAHSLAMVRL